jgi:hypothetical protein
MSVLDYNLRKLLGPEMIVPFRALLYNKHLTYGARCLGMAILDSPGMAIKKNSIMAKRLETDSSTIARWSKELSDARIFKLRKQN